MNRLPSSCRSFVGAISIAAVWLLVLGMTTAHAQQLSGQERTGSRPAEEISAGSNHTEGPRQQEDLPSKGTGDFPINSQRIAFLRLRMVAGRVQLLGFQIKPGRLKPHTNPSETLEIKVNSPTGEMLWQGTTQNPLVRRLEWEDSTTPGRIRSLNVPRPDPVFSVRVPFLKENQIVRFLDATTFPNGNKTKSEIGVVRLKTQ